MKALLQTDSSGRVLMPPENRNVVLHGELAARSIKNFARLHDRCYRPGIVGTSGAENPGWPGDWEGRTILALTLEGQSLKIRPAFLQDIVTEIVSHCNRDGYRGALLDESAINEQQLAGHGWLLRGLVEYYRWTEDGSIRDAIERIVGGLYLPVAGHFANYPSRPEDRQVQGGTAVGRIATRSKEWLLSSDIGCAFIALDGLSQAYELLRTPALGRLIEEMIESFFAIDFAGTHMQTHASLTGMRGVMRMYVLTRRTQYLDKISELFSLYKRKGMTENFANFNLFCKPSWTEPCGIIDSYMLAMSLWEHTGNPALLEDAHAIWYNGVERGQRPNGGFGCDTCVEDGTVGVSSFYEAFWCCTMRGAEGLGVPMRSFVYESDDTITLPFYIDAEFTRACGGREVLLERSRYPVEGDLSLEVLSGRGGAVTVKMFLPSWAGDPIVRKDDTPVPCSVEKGFVVFRAALNRGAVYRLTFGVPLLAVPAQTEAHAGKGLVTLRHGLLVLGSEEPCLGGVDVGTLRHTGNGRYANGEIKLAPLNMAYLMKEVDLKSKKYQILFRPM